MKLTDTLILSTAVALIIIAIHQVMTVGIAQNYWIVMMAIGFLLWFQYRKIQRKEKNKSDNN